MTAPRAGMITYMTDQHVPSLDGYHCARCGLDALSVPSSAFLDWEVSCVDDRVIVCPDCVHSGQPALDAIDVALLACADMPRTPEDSAFEANRDAAVAAIATWRDESPDSCR
jgi:DNA-directed RNA polymerase subunit RPC12/RpoP